MIHSRHVGEGAHAADLRIGEWPDGTAVTFGNTYHHPTSPTGLELIFTIARIDGFSSGNTATGLAWSTVLKETRTREKGGSWMVDSGKGMKCKMGVKWKRERRREGRGRGRGKGRGQGNAKWKTTYSRNICVASNPINKLELRRCISEVELRRSKGVNFE